MKGNLRFTQKLTGWDSLKGQGRAPIRFIGVWDTVDAVGLPFDNLSQFFLRVVRWITSIPGFSWLKIQLLLNLSRRLPFFNTSGREWESWGDDDDLHPCIEKACHAISIDDERKTFHPVLWLEYTCDGDQHTHKIDRPDTLLRDVKQVWFSGVHANVGGGYPKDHLAYVSLEWMMRHAGEADLVFNKFRLQDYHQEQDELGKLYDSRGGGGVVYRYKPRTILDISREVGIDGDRQKPLIHQSVLHRIENSTKGYAPFGAPQPHHYDVISNPDDKTAKFKPSDVTEEIQKSRDSAQQKQRAKHANPDADHYERCWHGDEKTQADARLESQINAGKLSDLRLYTYYLFCLWIVALFGVGWWFGEAWPWAMLGIPQGVTEALYAVHGFAVRDFPQFGPVCLGVLACAVAAAAIDLATSARSKKQPGVARTVFRSIWVGLLGFAAQPLITEALALALPKAVEGVLAGVTSSRPITGMFVGSFAGIVFVSQVCKRRIREWSLYGWQVSLGYLQHLDKPEVTIWESLREQCPPGSFLSRLVERVILPISAIGILLVALALFVFNALG